MNDIKEILSNMGFVEKQDPFTGRNVMGKDLLQDCYGLYPPTPDSRFIYDIEANSFKNWGLDLPRIDVTLETKRKIIEYMNISEFFDKNKL